MILALGLGGLVLLLAWFVWGGQGRAPEPTAHRRLGEAIDYTALERAEQEVRDAPDEDGVRDWGPGVQQPPIV
ncbi:MAG TPA: hypothetical protein VEU55_00975 [Gemmatimonadales bacterium]|nr:hypothetical protein [Gemmatimonadales bacterium]